MSSFGKYPFGSFAHFLSGLLNVSFAIDLLLMLELTPYQTYGCTQSSFIPILIFQSTGQIKYTNTFSLKEWIECIRFLSFQIFINKFSE